MDTTRHVHADPKRGHAKQGVPTASQTAAVNSKGQIEIPRKSFFKITTEIHADSTESMGRRAFIQALLLLLTVLLGVCEAQCDAEPCAVGRFCHMNSTTNSASCAPVRPHTVFRGEIMHPCFGTHVKVIWWHHIMISALFHGSIKTANCIHRPPAHRKLAIAFVQCVKYLGDLFFYEHAVLEELQDMLLSMRSMRMQAILRTSSSFAKTHSECGGWQLCKNFVLSWPCGGAQCPLGTYNPWEGRTDLRECIKVCNKSTKYIWIDASTLTLQRVLICVQGVYASSIISFPHTVRSHVFAMQDIFPGTIVIWAYSRVRFVQGTGWLFIGSGWLFKKHFKYIALFSNTAIILMLRFDSNRHWHVFWCCTIIRDGASVIYKIIQPFSEFVSVSVRNLLTTAAGTIHISTLLDAHCTQWCGDYNIT